MDPLKVSLAVAGAAGKCRKSAWRGSIIRASSGQNLPERRRLQSAVDFDTFGPEQQLSTWNGAVLWPGRSPWTPLRCR